MKFYYPKDANGNVIGFKTPESQVYDSSGVNLTSKLNSKASTSDLNVQKARIDAIASLPSGSTSGDAELIDIRTKADGTTATSAGNAVREQITDLNNDLTRLFLGSSFDNMMKYTTVSNMSFEKLGDGKYKFTTISSPTGNNGFYIPLPVETYGIKRIEFDITSSSGCANIFISPASSLSPMTYIYNDTTDVTNKHVVCDLNNIIINRGNNNRFQIWNVSNPTPNGYFIISNFVAIRETAVENNLKSLMDNVSFVDLKKMTQENGQNLELSVDGSGVRFTTKSTSGNSGYKIALPLNSYSIKRIEFDIESNNGSPNIIMSKTNSLSPFITLLNKANTTFTKTHMVYDFPDDYISSGDNVTFRVYNASSPALNGYFTISNFVCYRSKSDVSVKIENVLIENPIISDMTKNDIWNLGSKTITDGVLIYTPVANNNCGTRSAVLPASNRNFLRFIFELAEDYSSDLTVYFMGKNTSNNSLFITLKTGVRSKGTYTIDIDMNNYVVYNDLDLSKQYYVAVTCNTSNGGKVVKFNRFDVYDLVSDLTVNTANEALNYLNSSVMAVDAKIETASNNVKISDENGAKYVLQVVNGGIHLSPVLASKILYIGNSLLLGFGDFGMAASNNQEDYYYYVNEYLRGRGVTVTANKLQGSTWEGYTSYNDQNTWMNNTLAPQLNNTLELVIVQLGDNVNTAEKRAVFAQGSENLLRFIRSHAPNARVAWVAAWYTYPELQSQVANACSNTGCAMVDISNLRSISGNQSYVGAIYTDSSGNQHEITSSGVASHPSSQGMRAVADAIIRTLF